jgi:hypothetical protein
MNRSAKETIRNLEDRIARLERQAHTMSKKDRARLDELQLLEDQDRLTSSQNKEYEALVKEYRLTNEYKSKQRTASTPVRRSAEKVLKAMQEMERELEKMPSFSRGKDPYYADLAERWYMLAMRVEEEIEHIAGAY